MKIILDEAQLIQEYESGLSFKKIAVLHNVHPDTVKNRIKHKVTPHKHPGNRKYPLNQKFFDKIDTQEKAYVLGIICADGCLVNGRSTIELCLKDSDIPLLQKIDRLVYLDNKDHLVNQAQFDKRTQLTYYKHKLSFHGIEIYNSVLKLGLVPKKSLVLTYPKITDMGPEIQRHFIRGYFDGDGSINFSNTRNLPSWRISFCGSQEFLSSIREEILKQTSIDFHIRFDETIFKAHIGGNFLVRDFCNWLYKDSTIHLDRKYQKYLECISQVTKNEEATRFL